LEASPGGRSPTEPTVDPSTAIALSVLADSIYLVDPATGVMHAVARNLTDFQSGYATWSPSHRFLAWGNGGISILDTETGKTRQLNQGQSLSMPAWSNDAGLTGGNPVKITVPPTIAPLATAWSPGPVLAFDGLKLDCVDAPSCVSTDSSEIWTIRPDGTGLRQITHVGHAENPKWSPDGTRILFIRRFTRSKTPRSELWVVASNGTGARRLIAATDVVAAAWSPNGRDIAMVRTATLPSTLQVWVAAVDGTNAHPVGEVVGGTDATIDW
jgi:Tol biopolymer transport system component